MIALQEADADLARQLMNWALPQAESPSLEPKRVSGKMVGKALETVCAFANTHGGWLLLGVEDAGKAQGRDRLFGIGENPEAVDELLRKLDTLKASRQLKRWVEQGLLVSNQAVGTKNRVYLKPGTQQGEDGLDLLSQAPESKFNIDENSL